MVSDCFMHLSWYNISNLHFVFFEYTIYIPETEKLYKIERTEICSSERFLSVKGGNIKHHELRL